MSATVAAASIAFGLGLACVGWLMIVFAELIQAWVETAVATRVSAEA